MKIAIPTTGTSLDDPCHERFGRAQAFCLVDSDTQDWSVHNNPAIDASGGAGIQAAQFIAELGARLVVSGSYGPKAFDALQAGDIQMYLLPPGKKLTGRQVLQSYQNGTLQPCTGPSHAGRHGGGGRRGGRA